MNPIKSVMLAVGGYTGKLGRSAANLPASAAPHIANRFDALAAYTDKRMRLGVEYFAAKNWNSVTSASSDTADGWSAFGSFAVTPKILAFGRAVWVKPRKGMNARLNNHYLSAGVDYKPLPPLDLAMVNKRERANHGLISTSNGTIGGPLGGTCDEFGLFGQFSF